MCQTPSRPLVAQHIKWPADGWGLVYETMGDLVYGSVRTPQSCDILICQLQALGSSHS